MKNILSNWIKKLLKEAVSEELFKPIETSILELSKLVKKVEDELWSLPKGVCLVCGKSIAREDEMITWMGRVICSEECQKRLEEIRK